MRTSDALILALATALFAGCQQRASAPSEPFPPDLVWETSGLKPRSVDLNGDGEADIEVTYETLVTDDYPSSVQSTSLIVRGLGDNRVATVDGEADPTLSDGVIIGPDAIMMGRQWTSYGAYLASRTRRLNGESDTQWQGPAVGVAERNLAVEFRIGGLIHYGWVRISVDRASGILTVHDHAYHPNAGSPIKSGVKL